MRSLARVAVVLTCTVALFFMCFGQARADDEPRLPATRHLEIAPKGTIRFAPVDSAGEPEVPEHFRLSAHEFPYEVKTLRGSGAVLMHKLAFPSPVETPVL